MADLFNLNFFLKKIAHLKDDFSIEASSKQSGETNSKRIANLICDSYLECGGDIHWAGILERKVYEEVKSSNFTCDPIPYDLNWEDKRAKARDKSFDPLKLALNRLDRYLGFHPIIIYLNNKIIEILSTEMEVKDADTRKRKTSRPYQYRRVSQSIQVQQINRVSLDARERIAIYPAGEQEICSGTGPHEVDTK